MPRQDLQPRQVCATGPTKSLDDICLIQRLSEELQPPYEEGKHESQPSCRQRCQPCSGILVTIELHISLIKEKNIYFNSFQGKVPRYATLYFPKDNT